MITLLGFLFFFYLLVTYNFWAKPKRFRRKKILRRPLKTWMAYAYNKWWPKGLRIKSVPYPYPRTRNRNNAMKVPFFQRILHKNLRKDSSNQSNQSNQPKWGR